MALAAILSACGGGGGSQESAITKKSSPPPAAAVIVGLDTPLHTITLLNTIDNSYAIALNDSGQVVGNYLDMDNHLNAFLWQGNTVTTIVENGQINQINKYGEIVGWLNPDEAFLYTANGTLMRLNTLGGASQALAINDSGEIAGRITTDTEKAFTTQNGPMQFINEELNGYAIAMNNVGDLLIKEVSGNSCRTLLRQNGTLKDLGNLGGTMTLGRDLNDAGQVVGWAQTATGDYHPFLWEDGVMTDLSTFTGNFGAAIAINNAGVILLKGSDVNGERNLLLNNGTVTDLGNFGSSYAVVNDLNNRGQIVGWMADAAGVMHAFIATPKN